MKLMDFSKKGLKSPSITNIIDGLFGKLKSITHETISKETWTYKKCKPVHFDTMEIFNSW